MPCQLPLDCLTEIFEILEDDKITLHSCLLVNRLWCEISVRILWRDIWNFKYCVAFNHRLKVASAILSTLTACLPNESKELLFKKGIVIPTPTSEPPLFNYAAFCKVLPIYEIGRIIDDVRLINKSLSIKARNPLVIKEVIRMFMNQISSLKRLTYYPHNSSTYNIIIPNNVPLNNLRNCLVSLSELSCSSNAHSEFYHQLSQICHNLQSLTVKLKSGVSNELKALISSQNNLKSLNLLAYDGNSWEDIIPALTNHSNTLTKLHLYSDDNGLPLSFISLFSNLQEIKFSFVDSFERHVENFDELQYVAFPQLQILKIPCDCPKPDYMMKFLEINGKNLQEFYMDKVDNDLNLSMAEFCPNLKKLHVKFSNYELNILKTVLNSCQYLESIKIMCGGYFLSEKEVLESIANNSPKSFYELKICNDSSSELLPDDLESFFISWKNRASKKSLNLIILKDFYSSLEEKKKNMKIIEKYINLGIIKKFKIKTEDDDEREEEEELSYI